MLHSLFLPYKADRDAALTVTIQGTLKLTDNGFAAKASITAIGSSVDNSTFCDVMELDYFSIIEQDGKKITWNDNTSADFFRCFRNSTNSDGTE